MKNKKLKFEKGKLIKIAEEFFKEMGFNIKLETKKIIDKTLVLGLKTEEPQILIGGHGQTLIEIQRILGKILRRKIGQQFFLDLDINHYKEKKIEYLKELAQTVADEVSFKKEEKVLSPMSSYERRIIHLELAEREDVKTESQGEEPERRIVVKPA